jgi:hypothetical protein
MNFLKRRREGGRGLNGKGEMVMRREMMKKDEEERKTGFKAIT